MALTVRWQRAKNPLAPLAKNRKFRKTAFRGPPNFDVFHKQHFWGILVKKIFRSHGVISTYDVIFSQKMTSIWRFFNKLAYFRVLKPLFILLMNRNYDGYSLSSLLQQISYFNKRAVLGLSANFLNIVIRKNEKKIFTPKGIFQEWKLFFQMKTILN